MARERGRGVLEREILDCLAASEEPMTAGEVLAVLPHELAYTTVMTTLTRMHIKQALVRETRGRAYAYALPDTLDTARASMAAFQMRRTLDAQGDHASVLTQFVANLSADDEQMLRRLLRSDGTSG